jgi:hypothetical protein
MVMKAGSTSPAAGKFQLSRDWETGGPPKCSVGGCDAEAKVRGWCWKH